ncbi:patatin-like phospholipase family protein [Mycolicibacterium holsaticum]|jgi:NTE family protein|uniref:Patatin n=1 Tax=Mycolicibacterium holsaticum TaxID=152142 RepID=A0A1E3RTV7_9MYCO|nr:patatin-like phospholipase family protein [Mycolicibacterium holsaticum]MDA4107079.1 esterase [Mycolicibacterium holsaticum DSM 44478 = JCM 12374]ODQ92862.1 patatin [Mycolicibacterium holsaticum]QZA11297.1 patatin-like phospholipase family protein [Mycolicibacterium holsaticum DSM 44478 = JCM 12374]UNC11213.1 patatin-like phospholipase family protein [Mycolicibacterium holsaticum DSM 44478 = JCM 12374]
MTGRARRRPRENRVLAGPRAQKSVSLALQGGGAHGAFTWGVLDALLEDGRFGVEAITGASAGALNAVVLVQGWLDGGADGARSHLETFWRRASVDGFFAPAQRRLVSRMLKIWSNQADFVTRRLSPYQTNPLNINPLRDAIEALIDFERVRACTDVEIFVSATNVWSGKIAIFRRAELTADHLMASACLPMVFQAVEIDGVPYWDGGYMGNPALFPLYYETSVDDILLVQINPLERRQTPRTAREIHGRLTEITFNGNLLRELRAVAFVKRLLDDGTLSAKNYKDVRLHRIDASGVLDKYPASSRFNAGWDFFVKLRDVGRETAKAWLAEQYDAVGVHATFDVRSVLG